MENMSYPITIFYDGACRMCVAQMDKFKEADKEKNLVFVDISKPDFNQEKMGLAGKPIKRYIYARDSAGRLVRGVDAFIWIWAATGKRILSSFIGLPLVKQTGKFIYRLVSRFRYTFGKKKDVCDFHCQKDI